MQNKAAKYMDRAEKLKAYLHTQATGIPERRFQQLAYLLSSPSARIALNKVKKELRIRGVEARKAEHLRKRQVTQLLKAKQEVPPDLLNPIPDPEKIAQESEIQEEANIQLISTIGWSGSQVDDDDETGFIRFSGHIYRQDRREFGFRVVLK
ncbi:hypothetical protein VC83_07866 [Pseudogymnoascus destructans]|uniref:Uncharacterized protein n=2 Tax=Pseudogymnoascus destructans TaxID=655981 RepID=L8G2K8_PSED2|nr:uncharacterized protein VC83_07866 [Pseudogymnoascus destructans]ELR07362.1 hypothetical protein GMDG_08377 [Pseudogymnoascus destructans 20631-21]OAF55717.1 hypothetical protein VC83_07866 [Pseudogymnoascus destructans]